MKSRPTPRTLAEAFGPGATLARYDERRLARRIRYLQFGVAAVVLGGLAWRYL